MLVGSKKIQTKLTQNDPKISIFVRLVFSVVFGGRSARRGPPRRPRAHKTHYKTRRKRKVTPTLCTRVRATVVFSKHVFKNAHLNRDHVQKQHSEMRYFEFLSSFAVFFGSITKPERECQKDKFEHTILTLSRRLQWFSKRAHRKALQNTTLWTPRVPEGQSTRQKPRSGEHMYATPEGEHDFELKTLKMQAARGETHIKPRKKHGV